MESGPVGLTRAEGRLATVLEVFFVAGAIGGSIFSKLTGAWWPMILFLGCGFTVLAGFTVYLCRSRRRSFRSFAVLVLPERWRRTSPHP